MPSEARSAFIEALAGVIGFMAPTTIWENKSPI